MPLVMIVDDSQAQRSALLRLLEREGYDTVPAEDGRHALAQLRQHQPDLIVTDLNMPGGDGLELLEALQQNPDHRDIPVIMLTAQSDTHCVRRAEQLGAKEYLIKATFSVGQMMDQVRKYTRELEH
jgi:CheY-like chemotaxis protein